MRRLALVALIALLLPTLDRAACALKCAAAGAESRTQATDVMSCHDGAPVKSGLGAVDPSCHERQTAALTAPVGSRPATSTAAMLVPGSVSAIDTIVRPEPLRASPPTSKSARPSFLPPLRI